MKHLMRSLALAAVACGSSLTLTNCAGTYGGYGKPNMGTTPTTEERSLQISSEPTGNFYYGRRYFVYKTRFWGYLRKPRQPWSEAALVIMNENSTYQPDRLPEDGPYDERHGYDQNYNYKITGSYTGRKIYDPNSNLFLPEFRATSFKLIDRSPGWLFSPADHYNPSVITLTNRSVQMPR
ncbi:hypothetical protein Rhal01_00421 [Rubritalea halochordaticola]|uniref:Lipoprotein n=2 Tax=Rubritalea halochordaticola TaxID=714537 RepID=A0ABP9UV77_9BACT